MRMHLTHSKNIRNFEDVARHLELEEDRLTSVKVNAQVHYAQGSSSAGISSNGNKRKNQGKGKAKGPKKQKQEHKKKARSKNKRKTNVARVRCYNCQLKGHYTRDCIEPRKVHSIYSYMSEGCVSSSLFLTEFNPLWVVDSGATDHVTKDHGTFIEF